MMAQRPQRSTLFPYTTLFRSERAESAGSIAEAVHWAHRHMALKPDDERAFAHLRSEEHTSELQSHVKLVCRLLLEKKNTSAVARKFTTAILNQSTCPTTASLS